MTTEAITGIASPMHGPPMEDDDNQTWTCRVCMQHSDQISQMESLFNRNIGSSGQTLAEVISLVGAVEVLEYDRLPKFCCVPCLRDVEHAYALRKLCQESDGKLRKLFPDVEAVAIKEEPVDTSDMLPLKAENIGYTPIEMDKFVEETSFEHTSIDIKEESAVFSESDNLEDNNDTNSNSSNDQHKEDVTSESLENEIRVVPTRLRFPDVFDQIPAVSFSCCGCRNSFDNHEALYSHGQAEHAVNKMPTDMLLNKKQCEICYKTLHDERTLRNHRKIGQFNYRCKSCGDIFPNRQRVCTHHKRMHGTNAFMPRKCCGCSQKLESAEEMKIHSEVIHLPKKLPPDSDRQFICNICFHNFQTLRGLTKHQTRQLYNKKSHQCAQCGKTFSSANLLESHEMSHTGEKIFQCPHCPKAYSNIQSHRKHVQQHTTPQKTYQCQFCSGIFKCKKGLREHELTHSGERPLVCPYCPATFARNSGLISHVRTHTGQKNYECPQCDKRFAHSSDRNRHVNLFHQKARPYPCFFCTKRYPRKDYRRKHMESVHPAELKMNPVPAIELAGSTQWL